MGIEIISFDVDGTLVDPDFNDLIWQKALPELVAEKQNIDFETALKMVQKEYDLVGDNNINWYDIRYWIEFYKLDLDYRELFRIYESEIKIYPEVHTVLEQLTEKYQLICISSMPREFLKPKIKDLKKYFQSVFSALTDFTQLKNETVYKEICERLDISPERVLHIGDSEKTDYLAAKKAGLNTLLIDRYQMDFQKKYPDNIINSLSEIFAKINFL
ncbi:MAG: HAD family hydrolase [Candidatus Caldatribacteriota bacterium]|jgi:putative hydrolase of the HAD superfamily|nr:HAD family hydrolase [Atribacterota bacterium]MDD3641194.1 HAD family hydrolase [Atribacterota bacterium]MDD4288232.1 HAD family hydrolase [Atribacterota bacterium]MDD4765518.1 HAD family hydrolase [Atribacterota bacterium]MDI9596570.1 HAD family hydrolase [Atribacterota bacterium]